MKSRSAVLGSQESRSAVLGPHSEGHWILGKIEHENGLNV